MNVAKMKRGVRAWLSERPRLLQAVFRVLGKPYTEIAVFRALVRPGDTVLDIGANTGQYTCLFATLAGKSGAVHAFEPIPPTFEILKENTAGYVQKYHVTLNDCAMGESEGSVKMFVADDRFTEASMVRHSMSSHTANYESPVTTVDRYVKEKGIGTVALIKCDVEGAELLAMKGARELLKSKTPPMLFLEAWSGWTKDFGYQPADLFSFLEKEAGYHIYHVYKGGIRRISAGDTLPLDSFPDFLNFLCVIPGIHDDRFALLARAGIAIVEE
jgi:FkbM family methyltransferase